MPLGSLKGEPNTENLNMAASLGFSDPRLQVVLPSKTLHSIGSQSDSVLSESGARGMI